MECAERMGPLGCAGIHTRLKHVIFRRDKLRQPWQGFNAILPTVAFRWPVLAACSHVYYVRSHIHNYIYIYIHIYIYISVPCYHLVSGSSWFPTPLTSDHDLNPSHWGWCKVPGLIQSQNRTWDNSVLGCDVNFGMLALF